jgi:tetratricopeptide (TPR) repeat protein
MMLGKMNRFGEAATALAEASPLLEIAGMPRALARCCEITGFLKMRTGDAANARTHYERSLALYRKIGAQREVLRMLGNHADLTWALGDLDAAFNGFRETIALLRSSTFPTKNMLGFNLCNLAGVQTERGELDEALAAALEGVPLLTEMGHAWINMDHFALRAARAGKIENAARLAGYADSAYATKETLRGPNEGRARGRVQALLQEKLTCDELARLAIEGAALSEDEACALALDE